MTLDDTKSLREGVAADLATAEGELADLTERYLAEPERELVEVVDEGIDLSREIATREQAIRDLELEQSRYKPAHSRYRQLASEIEGLYDQIAEARLLERAQSVRFEEVPNEARERYRGQLAAKEREVDSLRKQLVYYDDKIQELRLDTERRAEDYRDLSELESAVTVARKDLVEKSEALQRKEQSLDIMLQARGRPFDIASPPTTVAVQPNAWIIVAFCLFAGLALGLALSMLAEYGRNSYRTVSDLAAVMTVPVLGAIGSIVTPAEARRAQLRRAIVGGSTAVIVGGVAWFTWVWYAAPEKLPVEVLKAIEDFRLMLM